MGWGFWVIFEKKAVSWDSDLSEFSWVYGVRAHCGVRSNSWDSDLGETSWFLSLGEARPVGSMRCTTRGWVRWNSQIVKIVTFSPRVENLKVKKVMKVSYLSNRESLVCWVFFGFLCMWTFYVSVYFTYLNISHICILVLSWIGYIRYAMPFVVSWECVL